MSAEPVTIKYHKLKKNKLLRQAFRKAQLYNNAIFLRLRFAQFIVIHS